MTLSNIIALLCSAARSTSRSIRLEAAPFPLHSGSVHRNVTSASLSAVSLALWQWFGQLLKRQRFDALVMPFGLLGRLNREKEKHTYGSRALGP